MSFLNKVKAVIFSAAIFALGHVASAAGDASLGVAYSHFFTAPVAYQSVVLSYGFQPEWAVYAGYGSEFFNVATQFQGDATDTDSEDPEEGDVKKEGADQHFFAGVYYYVHPSSEVTPVVGAGVRYQKGVASEVYADCDFLSTCIWNDWQSVDAVDTYYAYVTVGLDWEYRDVHVGFDVAFNKAVGSSVTAESDDDDDDSEEEGVVNDDSFLSGVGIQANVSVGYYF